MRVTKVLKGIIVFLILLLVGALVGGGLYLKTQYDHTTYFNNTYINGYDMSMFTPQQALNTIAADYSYPTITINENGEAQITGQLADFGYVVDQEKLLASLAEVMNKQKSNVLVLVESLMSGGTYNVTIPYTFYEDKLNAMVTVDALSEPRFSSEDAYIKFAKKKKEYTIVPEVYGNEFDEADFRSYVKEQISAFVNGNTPNESCTIDFPTDIYIKPALTDQDLTMNTQVNIYNRFCKSEITYVFGSKTETYGWDTIQNWLSIVEGEPVLDDTKMYEFVMDLASRYNTRHYDRKFHTSIDTDIIIPSSENDYGYTVDEDAEYFQLLEDVRSNTKVEREPIYYVADKEYGTPYFYRRDGRDDLAGNYVEVNLTLQHMWFYMDGNLVVDSDFVSGCVAKKAETKTGVFPVAYKESPSVLRGNDAANGYETKVQFWMPFYEGQGLHDATWRSSFGGNIYQTNGSHGCVNLPYYAAEMVYNYIDAGVPVIIYK